MSNRLTNTNCKKKAATVRAKILSMVINFVLITIVNHHANRPSTAIVVPWLRWHQTALSLGPRPLCVEVIIHSPGHADAWVQVVQLGGTQGDLFVLLPVSRLHLHLQQLLLTALHRRFLPLHLSVCSENLSKRSLSGKAASIKGRL